MENYLNYLTNINPNVESFFSRKTKLALNTIYEITKDYDKKIYLVGGIVRDIFLCRKSLDIDLVVEGSSKDLASLIIPKFHISKERYNEKFLTYNIFTKAETNIDIATFRSEIYEYPGALPTVSPTYSVEQDAKRRDFTINAMYISFDSEANLYDPLNGLSDLENKIVRVIHEKSFFDDPTRIFRAIKFCIRLGFEIEPHTKELIKIAMNENCLSTISMTRLKNELYILLYEKDISTIITFLRDYKIFKFLKVPDPDDEEIKELESFIRKDKYLNIIKSKYIARTSVSRPNFIVLYLLKNLTDEEKESILKEFQLSKKNIKKYILYINEFVKEINNGGENKND